MSDMDKGAPRPPARPRQPRRVSYPNLSPTRSPQVQADAELWPAWASVPVETLDWDQFDDDGHPVEGGPR